ncbi:hypothetical protein [Paraburkholderia sp.]|jgi:hypothetical protein|uniref:hypothetical protein n=1 Tax=Paraburkholderia sp. TaxID=1926495 RepID=UPI003C4DC313
MAGAKNGRPADAPVDPYRQLVVFAASFERPKEELQSLKKSARKTQFNKKTCWPIKKLPKRD